MGSAEIRDKLHQYIASGDDKLLHLMYAVAKEYSDDDDFEYTMDATELAELEKRRNDRLNGKSKTYSWEIAKEMITGKRELE
jgi:hypothetical protein